jgi:diguanylate cyclase (GGDEF)-like protein
LIAANEIFVLADEKWADAISQQMVGAKVASQADAYDGLMQLGSRRWPTVILDAENDEFASLCRSVRLLQPDSRLLAMCSPALEAMVGPMVGSLLDGYFILPPDRAEIAELFSSSNRTGQSAGSGVLQPGLVARLIESSRSMQALEAELASVVSDFAGQGVRWADSAEALPTERVLLMISGENRRVLLAGNQTAISTQACDVLETIKLLLPALVQTAGRTSTLHKLAVTDHLTGAYNRRYFYHLADQILRRGKADDRIALLLYDIDDFKQYNDNFGYAVGDEILRQMAGLMKKISREQDIVARIGGDEFAVLFWDSQGPRSQSSEQIQTAEELSERFRQAVAKQDFPLLGPQAVGQLTISGGLARFPDDGKDVRELLRSADRALKKGKQAGKNTIQVIGR